jgi:hypothetical protein
MLLGSRWHGAGFIHTWQFVRRVHDTNILLNFCDISIFKEKIVFCIFEVHKILIEYDFFYN